MILPVSEEGIAMREEVLSLGIVPMAVQNLMHASSTIVAPAAGVPALLCPADAHCCWLRLWSW